MANLTQSYAEYVECCRDFGDTPFTLPEYIRCNPDMEITRSTKKVTLPSFLNRKNWGWDDAEKDCINLEKGV